jgi:hypothetical protein
MSRVLICTSLLALGSLLAGVRSAAPPRHTHPAASSVHKMALVDRVYQEIDFPGLDDPKQTLIEVLDKMAKDYQLTFDVNERAFKYEMLPDVLRVAVVETIPIRPMRARLGEVLQCILSRVMVPSGAVWLLRRDHIEITTGQFAIAEIRDKGRFVDREGEGGLYIPRPLVHSDLRKKPLSQALETIADRAGWNIVLDEAVAKEKAGVPVSARLRNVPVDTAVLLLASQAGLGMAEVDNAFFVTTQEKAAGLGKRHADLRPPHKKPARK